MTIIAMVILTQVGATLLAITITATLAATASAVATLPDSTQSRHCFRATAATGAGEAIFVAVDSFWRARARGPNLRAPTPASPRTDGNTAPALDDWIFEPYGV
jgi:hypothetical protein